MLLSPSGGVKLPFKIPGGFAAVGAGVTLLAAAASCGFDWSGAPPLPAEPPRPMTLQLPKPQLRFMALLLQPQFYRYISVIIPMLLVNLINNLANIEAASAVGDRYDGRSCLLGTAILDLGCALLGNPYPGCVYIGHAAFKAMGCRVGYLYLNMVPSAYFGLLQGASVLLRLVPIETGVGFLLWVGLQITASGFEGDQTPEGWKHGPAVAIGLLPSIAAWGWQAVSTTFLATRDMLCASDLPRHPDHAQLCETELAELIQGADISWGGEWLDPTLALALALAPTLALPLTLALALTVALAPTLAQTFLNPNLNPNPNPNPSPPPHPLPGASMPIVQSGPLVGFQQDLSSLYLVGMRVLACGYLLSAIILSSMLVYIIDGKFDKVRATRAAHTPRAPAAITPRPSCHYPASQLPLPRVPALIHAAPTPPPCIPHPARRLPSISRDLPRSPEISRPTHPHRPAMWPTLPTHTARPARTPCPPLTGRAMATASRRLLIPRDHPLARTRSHQGRPAVSRNVPNGCRCPPHRPRIAE